MKTLAASSSEVLPVLNTSDARGKLSRGTGFLSFLIFIQFVAPEFPTAAAQLLSKSRVSPAELHIDQMVNFGYPAIHGKHFVMRD